MIKICIKMGVQRSRKSGCRRTAAKRNLSDYYLDIISINALVTVLSLSSSKNTL